MNAQRENVVPGRRPVGLREPHAPGRYLQPAWQASPAATAVHRRAARGAPQSMANEHRQAPSASVQGLILVLTASCRLDAQRRPTCRAAVTRYFGQENRAWSLHLVKQRTLPRPVQSLQEPHFQIGQTRVCSHRRPRLCVVIVLVRILVGAVDALAVHVRPERGLARVSRPDRCLEVLV